MRRALPVVLRGVVCEYMTDADLLRCGEFSAIRVPNEALREACLLGDTELVQRCVALGASNWVLALKAACRGGHFDLVRDIHRRVVLTEQVAYSAMQADRKSVV